MNGFTFSEFKERTKWGLDHGTLSVSKPLSDLDMAIQYAIGQIGDERGYPCDVTPGEIEQRIRTFADEGIFERDAGWFWEGK